MSEVADALKSAEEAAKERGGKNRLEASEFLKIWLLIYELL